MALNRELFFLTWDCEGHKAAAYSAYQSGVCLAQTQIWMRQRDGIKKAIHPSKMLQQKRHLAFRRV